jgi:hypothetical protein
MKAIAIYTLLIALFLFVVGLAAALDARRKLHHR